MIEPEDPAKKYIPLTDGLIRDAVRNDKGEAAELVSWKWEDFTKKGDNYACFVTGVKVQYKENKDAATQQEARYVAKISHQVESAFTSLMNDVFKREGACFLELLPKMNDSLKALHIDPIRTAKGYSMSVELGKEVLMVEDLRLRNFKMFDRRLGLDVAHANLVLKELGRLHAASILEEHLGGPLTDRWPVILEKWVEQKDNNSTEIFRKVFQGQMDAAAMVMEKIPKYENVVKWIRDMRENAMETFLGALKRGNKFEVLCHGDCWNNNILFRYDKEGVPVEVMLVDLQGMRKASAAADLSYFLHTSFTGNVRNTHYHDFITTYYNTFTDVLQAAKIPPPFTQDELLQELIEKLSFGCLSGMILAPLMLSEEQDVRGFTDLTEENIEETSAERRDIVIRMSERGDGQLLDRYLALFDELVEAGIVSRSDEAAQ